MRRDDGRLRARLGAALTAAIAIAFVVTVAAVASSPAPRSDEAATPPPSATGPSHPTTTSGSSAPTTERAGERSPAARGDADRDLPDPDETRDDAREEAPAASPAPTPSATPEEASPAPADPEASPATPRAERSPAPRDHGAPLWGRWFRAEHLRQGDETVIVAGDRPLHVGFLRQEGGDGLVWMTSCNTFGGDLAVRRERLDVRDIGGTAEGCEEVQQEQEEWLAAFLADAPHWRLLGERLRLWTPDGGRIDLVEDPAGPGPPWS